MKGSHFALETVACIFCGSENVGVEVEIEEGDGYVERKTTITCSSCGEVDFDIEGVYDNGYEPA